MEDDNKLGLELTEEFRSLYWAYNVPLQMWPNRASGDPDDEDSPIVSWRPLNYMPRKERCADLDPVPKSEIVPYCRNAAKVLRNLARLFDALADGEIEYIYYPDDTKTEEER